MKMNLCDDGQTSLKWVAHFISFTVTSRVHCKKKEKIRFKRFSLLTENLTLKTRDKHWNDAYGDVFVYDNRK